MALCECPDCGGKVSDQAPACPHCGRPSDSGKRDTSASRPVNQRRGSMFSLTGVVGAMMAVLGGVGGCAGIASGNHALTTGGLLLLLLGTGMGAKYK